MSLTLISGNLNKVRETQSFVTIRLDHHALDLPEIQSLDPEEVVVTKATAAYEILQKPVLVEDTSLVFSHLGQLPGTFIKWFLQELQPAGLCRLADLDPNRQAVASVMYGLHTGSEVKTFQGSMTGTISQQPAGENGFGWDAVFIPQGESRTWAEHSDAEKATTSIRKQALTALEAWLQETGLNFDDRE